MNTWFNVRKCGNRGIRAGTILERVVVHCIGPPSHSYRSTWYVGHDSSSSTGPLVGCRCVFAARLPIRSVLWIGAFAMCSPSPPLRPPCNPCGCGCSTPSNHICALDRCISDVFPYRLVREKSPPPLPLPCKVGSRCSVQSCVKKAPAEILVYAASKSTLNQGGQGAFFTHQPVSTISVLLSFATSCLL